MQCKVCAIQSKDDDIIKFYFEKGCQFLCDSCASETPDKLPRDEFNKAYWGPNWLQVRGHIRASFYDDYRNSKLDFRAYVAQTTTENIYA